MSSSGGGELSNRSPFWQSLALLPRWYQGASLGLVLLLFLLDQRNAILAALVRHLHVGLGVELLWPLGYQQLLAETTLLERLYFTLYAAVLSAFAVVFYRLSTSVRAALVQAVLIQPQTQASLLLGEQTQQTLGAGTAPNVRISTENQKALFVLFPTLPPKLSIVLLSGLAVLEAAWVLQSNLPLLFSSERSAKYTQTSSPGGGRSASSGPSSKTGGDDDQKWFRGHLQAQQDIFLALCSNVLWQLLLPSLCAFGYLCSKYCFQRKTAVSLRWVLLSVLVSRMIFTVGHWLLSSLLSGFPLFASTRSSSSMTGGGGDEAPSSFLWPCLRFLAIWGLSNHTYGSRRASGEFPAGRILHALRLVSANFLTVLAVECSSLLLVLAAMVGSHVVEILGIWLLVFMVALWIPAAVDSFSTDFAALFSAACAFLIYTAFQSSEQRYAIASRVGVLTFLAFVLASAVYLRLVQLTGSRRWASSLFIGLPVVVGALLFLVSSSTGGTTSPLQGLFHASSTGVTAGEDGTGANSNATPSTGSPDTMLGDRATASSLATAAAPAATVGGWVRQTALFLNGTEHSLFRAVSQELLVLLGGRRCQDEPAAASSTTTGTGALSVFLDWLREKSDCGGSIGGDGGEVESSRMPVNLLVVKWLDRLALTLSLLFLAVWHIPGGTIRRRRTSASRERRSGSMAGTSRRESIDAYPTSGRYGKDSITGTGRDYSEADLPGMENVINDESNLDSDERARRRGSSTLGSRGGDDARDEGSQFAAASGRLQRDQQWRGRVGGGGEYRYQQQDGTEEVPLGFSTTLLFMKVLRSLVFLTLLVLAVVIGQLAGYTLIPQADAESSPSSSSTSTSGGMCAGSGSRSRGGGVGSGGGTASDTPSSSFLTAVGLPHKLRQVISFVVSVILLGGLMDAKKVASKHFAKAVGLQQH